MKRLVIGICLLLTLLFAGCDQPRSCPDLKRCEYAGEFRSPDPTVAVKSCSYRCRGYGALANFEWPVNQPCPPSFDGNFPGP
jgi:hypothetical protein